MNWLKQNYKVLAWIMSVFVAIMTWFFTLQNTVSAVKEIKPKMEVLEKFKERQEVINENMDKKLDRIDWKLDRLLRR